MLWDLARLEPGDVVVDGGNTHYPDDIRRAQELEPRGIHYLDWAPAVASSARRGYCLVIGGDEGRSVGSSRLRSLAPRLAAAPRRARTGASARGARLPALRPSGAGLREDGAQRDRVRPTAAYAEASTSSTMLMLARRARGGRGDRPSRIRSGTSTSSTWPRSRSSGDAAASSHRSLDLTARATSPRRSTGSRGACPTPGRDAGRRSRRSRPGRQPGARDRALLAVHVEGRGGLREPRPLGDADQFGARGKAEVTLEVEVYEDAEAAARRPGSSWRRRASEAPGAFALALSKAPDRLQELARVPSPGTGRRCSRSMSVAPRGTRITSRRASLPFRRACPRDAVDDPDLEVQRTGTRRPPPALDIVHLGLGVDGHTASLVPGDPVLEVDDRPRGHHRRLRGPRRMTLTYTALRRQEVVCSSPARGSGGSARLLARDPSIPAAGRGPRQSSSRTPCSG